MNISKTFIISLPHRLTDRLIPLIDYLKSIGLDYFVHGAIKDNDGRKGLVETIKQLFNESINQKLEIIMVLEDDCSFIENPKNIIDRCLGQLPQDFDMCSLGCNLWQSHVYKYSENLIQLSDAYATHAVIYSKSGMDKILKAINENNPFLPLDVLIKERIMLDGKCFCSLPMAATQIISYSDIENKITNWGKVLQERFKEKTAHL